MVALTKSDRIGQHRMPFTWLRLEEVAAYLRVPPSTVAKWARAGDIPCVLRSGQFLFRRGEVECWASKRLLRRASDEAISFHRAGSAAGDEPAPLLDALLRPDGIQINLPSRTRASVIRDIVALAEQTGLVNDPEDLLRMVCEREAEASTALEGGVALLHAGHREPYVVEDSFIVMARTIAGIPFGAPDGHTTDVFFLICCTDEHGHLQTLARLCGLCLHTDVLLRLRAVQDAAAAHALVLEKERELLDRIRCGKV